MINVSSLFVTRALKVSALCIAIAGSSTALAQASACVYLQPGAGYAAWMRVVSGGYSSDWSSSFPIGQTRCQSLSAIADGQEFTVEISAVLGSSKVHCQPDNVKRVASSPSSITYLASGTTLNVKCSMPSADNEKALDATVTPNKDGVAAAKKIKAKGANLKAPD